MAKVKKIGVFSFAKLQTLIMAMTGLIAGILYSIGGAIIDALVSLEWITSTETPGLSYGTVLAFGALIGMPAIFAIFGFIAGLIEGILYNLFAKRFGGVNLDFEQEV